MASKKELQALITLAGKIDPSLQSALRKAQSETLKTSSAMSKLSKTVDSVFKGIGKAALYVGAPLAAGIALVAKNGLQLASDLTEVQNVVDVTFGSNAKQINQWSQQALKNFGLSELQAKRYTATLGAMLKSSGLTGKAVIDMSENLAGLAGDLASFYNISQQEAFEKIQAGISGEVEPLRQLGINMTVANLQAYALSKGIKVAYKDMDQATQTALRYSYIMSVTKDAQGDFNRTQGSFANQMRLLQNNIDQLSAKIMQTLLPVITKYVQKANKFIDSIAGDPTKIQQIQNAISNVADAIIKFGTDAMPYVSSFAQYIKENWLTIKDIAIGVGIAFATWKVGETVYGAYKAVTTFTQAIRELSMAIAAAKIAYATYYSWKIKDMFTTLYLQALYAKDAIAMGIRTAAMWAMTAATSAWTAITTVATTVGSAFAAVLAFITSPIGLVILGIMALVGAIILLYKNWDSVSKLFVASWEWIKNAFTVGINWIVDKINWLIQKINLIPGIKIPLIPEVQTSNKTGPKMRKYANGGLATQPSIFGEAGPEMAIPIKYKNPRSLSLLNQTARAIGAQPYGTVPNLSLSFNFYGPVSNQNDVVSGVKMAEEYIRQVVSDIIEEKERVAFGLE
ncbi:phage tail tape measure protein [Caldanaerobius polysaccharolyticus]|uniref:hypothetical protein n=1 Tax=Caldanaerobius polysaccharolyticus TaxID=44256 RepID=UPI00047D93AF|nr:hypothetical protein [Caldanaerobius polysaccharolyticus]